MRRQRQLKPGAKIFIILTVFIGTFFIEACNVSPTEVYDDVVTETLQVTYQNGDIDTLTVERNPMCPYSLKEGDLKARKESINEKTIAYSTFLIKCGVRDYKVLETTADVGTVIIDKNSSFHS